MAQTRAQLPVLQTGITQSRHALALLAGAPPASLDALLRVARPVPQPAPDLALALPADTLRQRSDVRAAELQITAALAQVAQAQAQAAAAVSFTSPWPCRWRLRQRRSGMQLPGRWHRPSSSSSSRGLPLVAVVSH